MKLTTLVNNKPAIKINKDGNVIVKAMKGNDKLKFKETESLVNVSEYDNNFANLPSKPFAKMDYSHTPSIIIDNDTSREIGEANSKNIMVVENETLFGFGIIKPDENNETTKQLLDAINSNKIESIQVYAMKVPMSITTGGNKDNHFINSIGSIRIISINTK
ncbi:hypothetical protein NGC67_01855 [Mammaliicoccus fleurettii]|uniref:hypothetical protein n=1 Tax=Mammaliicoccus fleurettii TaxID=150056 RepID=UPI002DB8D321|nr:hypothetical protein [Mammaliicoccus fleurettii]MEB7805414.1 hypothetical protein [Mammaliicoccus fleurettii]